MTHLQVAEAIQSRKQKFIEHMTGNKQPHDVEDTIAFNHICTVLDHAHKIFQLNEHDFLNITDDEPADIS